MAKKCCPWKIILVAVLILVIAGGFYWWKTTSETQKDTNEPDEVTEEVEIYEPSEDLLNSILEAEDDLSMSLLRGDAELAPTYEEFMISVNNAQDKLEASIEDFYAESEGKELPDNIVSLFSDVKALNDELSMSLMRGDAELAPTYEEYMLTVIGINDRLKVYMEEVRDL